MEEYTLIRTGDRPLKFAGEIIAEAGRKWHAGQEQNRWHEIKIYKTAGGKYVLNIDYFTLWQSEDDDHAVTTHDSITDAVSYLRSYDPVAHLVGYPPHPTFTEKQARLENSLRQRWAVLITEILDEIPEAVEQID